MSFVLCKYKRMRDRRKTIFVFNTDHDLYKVCMVTKQTQNNSKNTRQSSTLYRGENSLYLALFCKCPDHVCVHRYFYAHDENPPERFGNNHILSVE